MVNLEQLRRWDPDALARVVGILAARQRVCAQLDYSLAELGRLDEWEGAAGDGARRSFAGTRGAVSAHADSVDLARRCAADSEEALRDVKRALRESEAWAQRFGFRIGPHGEILDEDAAGDDGARTALRLSLHDRVEGIVRSGTRIEADATAALSAADHDQDFGGPVGDESFLVGPARVESVPEPPADGTPVDNASYWSALTATQQEAIVREHPEWVGNLDGLPAGVRDLTNRSRLDLERGRLEEVAAGLRAELDANIFGGTFSNADAGLAQTLGKLAALDAIEHTLALGGRQLLVLDTSGREAMAAVAIGDVDRADHVSVFTPGAGSTVQGHLAGYDADAQTLRDETLTQLNAAGRGSETVAAVTWMNYQAPHFGWDLLQTDRTPASDLAASRGAARLADFLGGIDASRAEDPHLTALGHSYGSLATSLALQRGTGVDDAIFYGSPGLGTVDVADLRLLDGHAYLIEAPGDLVADLGSFGRDPSFVAGLTPLSSAPGPDVDGVGRSGSSGHGEYSGRGTMSQYNMSVVVGGMPERAIR